ncbi:MAG: hypothetical protein MJ077_10620 [Oscillospiraceae bacterium]|nr:hypothetical protein [Oscillospiraceae bacterium]
MDSLIQILTVGGNNLLKDFFWKRFRELYPVSSTSVLIIALNSKIPKESVSPNNHTKKVYSEYRSITSKHQQRQFGNQNLSALELHSQACANLNEYKRSHGYADKPLPSSHQLMDKKTTILNHQNTLKTEIESLRESVNLLQNAQSDVMTACSDLGLTNHREYETIFGKKMSIRKQIQRKKYTEQHSQNGHNLHSLWKKYLELD